MTESNPRSRKRFTVDELFSDTRAQASGAKDLPGAKLIDLNRIHPDPAQPRRTFDPDKLEELASSIRAEGVLQPIVVRFDSEHDRYVIVHGERRWRAAKQAKLTSLPSIVKEVPVERRLVQQLMENVVRDDLNAIDRGAAIRALRSQMGDPTWDVVADAVGIKRSRLFQLLGTGKLSEAAREDIQAGRLSEKQSRALQGLTEALAATPRSRIRIHRQGGAITAFAISGMAGGDGYLQRLAVVEAGRRDGVGRQLTLDALRWMRRRRARRALVNTYEGNDAALRLYEGVGFHELSPGLVVLSIAL